MLDFDLKAQKLSTPFIVFLMTSGFILSFWYTFRSPTAPQTNTTTFSRLNLDPPQKTGEITVAPEDRVTVYSRHLSQGQNYLKTQQFDQAEAELQSALEILDSEDVRSSLSEAKFLQQEKSAESALQGGQLEEAVIHLKKALSFQDHEKLRILLSQTELKLQTLKLEQQNKEEREHWLKTARQAVQAEKWEDALEAYSRVQAFGTMENTIAQEIQQIQQTLEEKAQEERFQKNWAQTQILLEQDWQNGLVFLSQLQKQFPQKKGELAFYREQVIQKKLTELMIEVPGGSY
ncbi:MAG: hypothetical protein AABZ60_10950, partial [Planctomycetota bacterium]